MRRFLDDNPRLGAAGAAGLILFLALFGRAFMSHVRPQPLSRDTLTSHALAFATEEGWTDPGKFAWAFPIEGDEAETTRNAAAAAGVPAPDRETLGDPAWEIVVVTSPRSIASAIPTFDPPSPLLSIEVTPEGEIVQYLEMSSPISAQPIAKFQGGPRDVPFRELQTDALFDVLPEDRLPATEEERLQAISLTQEFFARHGIAVDGAPKSFAVKESRRSLRAAYLTWEAPGPVGTVSLTRVVVWNGRVAGFDRDLRPVGYTTPLPKPNIVLQIATALPALFIFLGGAFIAVMIVIKRRQGELDLRSATTVFFTYFSSSLGLTLTWFGLTAGMISLTAGHVELWFGIINIFVTMPIVLIVSSFMIAGAWAAGEGQAYIVWPQQLIRPFSALLRGNFRSPEAAGPIVVGYLAAFAALGGVTALGLVTPAPPDASVAPLFQLSTWPMALAGPLNGLVVALSYTIVAGIFAMTYARLKTRRLWIVVPIGAVVLLGLRSSFNAQQFFPGLHEIAILVGIALAIMVALVFVRYGPLASFTAIYAYTVLISSYPLLLTGNTGHAASGAWSLLFGFVPAAIATYGTLRPREHASASIPAHVRRALDRLRISEEFEVARHVQARLLPATAPYVPGLDIAGLCVPANEVGGDYFDYFKLADDRLGIAIGDVSGKGVGAAIYMTLTKSYMVTQSSRDAEPVGVLSRVNEHLRRNLARGTFVTMVYAVVDVSRRTLVYTRAGHNPPLLVRNGGEGDFLSAPGIALGAAGRATFQTATRAETIDLNPGDLVLLYTDGVTEAMDLRSDEYGETRLITLLRKLAGTPATAAEVIDALLKDVRAFAGRAPQHDDITIIAMRVHGP